MPALKNARHERFAQAYAVKSNAAAAWRKATGKKANADVNGANWLVRAGIKERVAELKDKADAKSEGITLLTIKEKREFFARVVRAHGANIDEKKDADLINGLKYDKMGNRIIEIPDKLAAIKLDNELAPENDSKGFEIIIRKL